jgi:adiponectin receptor
MILLKKEVAPPYSIEPFVLSGYRPKMSYAHCLQSICTLHNQTLNIWSSILLIGFNIFLVIFFTNKSPDMPFHFQLFFWTQGILRSYCWINSWSFHTFVCHSKNIAQLCLSMDYLGCYLTPFGIGTNLLFIEFYCHINYQIFFILCNAIVICLAIIISTFSIYQTEKYRQIRLLFSITTSLPSLIGLLFSIYIVHVGNIPEYYSYLVYAILFELLAGFFYVTMFPEVIYPFYFDIWMNSHSIWHWLNFGFDYMMMALTYNAYLELKESQRCLM